MARGSEPSPLRHAGFVAACAQGTVALVAAHLLRAQSCWPLLFVARQRRVVSAIRRYCTGSLFVGRVTWESGAPSAAYLAHALCVATMDPGPDAVDVRAGFFAACERGHARVARTLLSAGNVDPCPAMRPLVWDPAHADIEAALVASCARGHVEVTRMLLAERARYPHHLDTPGWPAFHAACAEGHEPVLACLMEERGPRELPLWLIRSNHVYDVYTQTARYAASAVPFPGGPPVQQPPLCARVGCNVAAAEAQRGDDAHLPLPAPRPPPPLVLHEHRLTSAQLSCTPASEPASATPGSASMSVPPSWWTWTW